MRVRPQRYKCPHCKWDFAYRKKRCCPGCGTLLLIASDMLSDNELTELRSFWMWESLKERWDYIRDWEEHKREAMQRLQEYSKAPIGESSDTAALWKHGAADCGAAPADRIGRGGGERNRVQGGEEGVSEKSLENEEVPGFPVPGRGRTGPFVVQPKSLGMEGMNKTAPTEVVGYILDAGQDAKTEILVENSAIDFLSEIWFSVVTFCHSAAEQRADRNERQ